MCVEHFFLFFFYSHVVCINAGGRLTLSAEDPRSQVFSHQRNRRKARQKRWRNAVHRMPEGKTHSPFYIFICNLPFSLSLSLFVYNIQPTLETWVVVVRKPSSPDERWRIMRPARWTEHDDDVMRTFFSCHFQRKIQIGGRFDFFFIRGRTNFFSWPVFRVIGDHVDISICWIVYVRQTKTINRSLFPVSFFMCAYCISLIDFLFLLKYQIWKIVYSEANERWIDIV